MSSFGVEHSSPATLQCISQSIHSYQIPPEVTRAVSPLREACKVDPAPRKFSCLRTAKGVRLSSKRQDPFQLSTTLTVPDITASSHPVGQGDPRETSSSAAVQPRNPGKILSDVPDARPRGLLACPLSETCQYIHQ